MRRALAPLLTSERIANGHRPADRSSTPPRRELATGSSAPEVSCDGAAVTGQRERAHAIAAFGPVERRPSVATNWVEDPAPWRGVSCSCDDACLTISGPQSDIVVPQRVREFGVEGGIENVPAAARHATVFDMPSRCDCHSYARCKARSAARLRRTGRHFRHDWRKRRNLRAGNAERIIASGRRWDAASVTCWAA